MAGPDPAVAAVRVAVRRVVLPQLPAPHALPPGSLILAACSGGADSVALLSGLAWEAPRAGLRAGVIHVDHGLIDDSADVASTVLATGKLLGVDVAESVRVEVDQAGRDGPEAAARTARYAALEQLARSTGAALTLLGHTMDDQAETVLLGLARGSGGRSLAGMAAQRGIFARPLLGLRRADTVRCCEALRLPVWTDPSNGDQALTRNRVRALALPALEATLGPGIAEALARTADLLRDDSDALESAAATAYAEIATLRSGCIELPVALLETLAPAVRRRVVQRAAVAIGVPAGSLSSVHLAAAERLITSWRGQGAVALPGGFVVTRRYANLLVAPGSSRLE